jgi:enamine deaminase RidA (YjgF/YER057c/UK114 family)
MPMHHSDDDAALRRHQTFDLAAAMTAATHAATAAFEAAGMPLPQVVVNVSWSEVVIKDQRSYKEFVAGSTAPARSSDFLAESLRASAEEVEAAAAAREPE